MNMNKIIMTLAIAIAAITTISLRAQSNDELGKKLILTTYIDDAKTAQSLLDQGVNINYQDEFGRTALMFAAIHDSENIAQLLINNGADLNLQNDNGNTALIIASADNSIDVVQLLIDNGASFTLRNKYKQSAYDLAKTRGNQAVLNILPKAAKPATEF